MLEPADLVGDGAAHAEGRDEQDHESAQVMRLGLRGLVDRLAWCRRLVGSLIGWPVFAIPLEIT